MRHFSCLLFSAPCSFRYILTKQLPCFLYRFPASLKSIQKHRPLIIISNVRHVFHPFVRISFTWGPPIRERLIKPCETLHSLKNLCSIYHCSVCLSILQNLPQNTAGPDYQNAVKSFLFYSSAQYTESQYISVRPGLRTPSSAPAYESPCPQTPVPW